MYNSTISKRSERCLSLLQTIERSSSSTTHVLEWTEDILLKLNLFIAKLGVFAGGSLSIDHRLRRHKTAANAISQLLDAAILDLVDLLHALGNAHALSTSELATGADEPEQEGSSSSDSEPASPISEDEEEDDDIGSYSEDGTESSSEDGADKSKPALSKDYTIHALCNSAKENVEDLLRYAALIRQHSASKVKDREELHSPQRSEEDDSDASHDEGGHASAASLTTRFEIHAKLVLRREFGPERYDDPSLAYLKDRLISAMVRRWRRTCYRHDHAKSLASKVGTAARNNVQPTSRPTTGIVVQPAQDSRTTDAGTDKLLASAPSVTAGTIISAATTLQSSFSYTKEPQPRSETVKSASRAGGMEHSLPPLPLYQRVGSEYVHDCLYCGRLPVTRKPFTTRSWRRHLWSDLVPYTCLYSGCRAPKNDYSSFDAWIEHTRSEHWTSLWMCVRCVGTQAAHDTQESFVEHLKRAHAVTNTNAEIASIAKYSRLESSCTECAVCGSEQGLGSAADGTRPIASPARQRDIQACMANHLEALALSSLPWHFGIVHNASSSQAQGSDVPETRSTHSSVSASSGNNSVAGSPRTATLAEIARHDDDEAQLDNMSIIETWNKTVDVTIVDKNDASSLVSTPTDPSDDVEDDFTSEATEHARPVDLGIGGKELARAAEGGDESIVRSLLGTGQVDPNNKDHPEGETPLWLAAKNGHTAVVRILLQSDIVDVNAANNHFEQTPLLAAVENGHAEVVRLLLETGKTYPNDKERPEGRTPLWIAAKHGYTEVARLLLETDIVAVDAADDALEQPPLLVAAASGHAEIVQLLLEHGADVTRRDGKNGPMPIQWAILRGHADVVDLILQRHPLDSEMLVDKNGRNLLSTAAENGHLQVLKLLLASGADVSARDALERTPLCSAALGNHLEVAELLLDHGADVDAVGSAGWTPLMNAAHSESIEAARVLLAHGANVDAAGDDGSTALSLAAMSGSLELVKLLLDHGADATRAGPWEGAEGPEREEIALLLRNAGENVHAPDGDKRRSEAAPTMQEDNAEP